ncbi:MAG: hypothetical protein K9N11_04835 [Lentisphaeria bacterium]|nr:hypothetical protein [Candidatus Neomarinimicrobiota bacterium]MCF7842161.1 hypothetical protein [Lentisphaeria bacterium]
MTRNFNKRGLPMVILMILGISPLWGQLMRPVSYQLTGGDSTLQGLIGNGISDMKMTGDTVWLGSGHGLSVTRDGGNSFRSYSRQFSDIGYGGVSGLTVAGDTVWAAFAIDSLVGDENAQTGVGIARSLDGGASWTRLPQPMDTLKWHYIYNDAGTQIIDSTVQVYSTIQVFGQDIPAVDVVTPIKNVTFDLAYDGKWLWAASFAGGLRRSGDLGETWQRVLLPWDNEARLDSGLLVELAPQIAADTVGTRQYTLDPVLHLNHRVFSVIAWDDTVWVGTAGGINVSNDGGRSWRHMNSSSTNMSGNWVVALHRQQRSDGRAVNWASTVTTGGSEVTGLSYHLEDESEYYWYSTLPGFRIHNFASTGAAIYAAGELGLFKSKDGDHFVSFPPIRSADGSTNIFSDAAYSVLARSDGALWVGTGDGLAITYNEGLTWRVEKAQAETKDQELIAYPNPFFPYHSKQLQGEGHLIIQYNVQAGASVSLKVYDWAMSEVVTLLEGATAPLNGSQESYWTGRNSAGHRVANGTYFIQLEQDETVTWTKVMVIN